MPAKKKQGSAYGSSLKSSVSSPVTQKSSSEIISPSADQETKSDKGSVPKPKINEVFRETIMREAKKRRKELKRAKKAGGEAWESFKSKLVLHATPHEFKSRSARARVAMPVDKLRKRVHEVCPASLRVPTEAGVALAAALDYGVSELLEVACKACDLKQQKTVSPRHIKLGVPQDESLAELFRDVTIPQGGTVPTVHPELAMGYRRKSTRSRDEAPAFRGASSAPTSSKIRKRGRNLVSSSRPIDKKEESSPSGTANKKRDGSTSPNDATDKDESSPISSDRVTDKEKSEFKDASSKGEFKDGISPSDPKDAKHSASPGDTSEKKDPSSPSSPKDGKEESKDAK